jgi:hypothetical protein
MGMITTSTKVQTLFRDMLVRKLREVFPVAILSENPLSHQQIRSHARPSRVSRHYEQIPTAGSHIGGSRHYD